MLDRDVVIGSVIGGYKRLKELDPNNGLLGYMALYPLSDQPLWERTCQAEFLRRFGDGMTPRHGLTISTATMENYWRALQSAAERIQMSRLEQHIETVRTDVNAALEYMAAPSEVQTAVARAQQSI